MPKAFAAILFSFVLVAPGAVIPAFATDGRGPDAGGEVAAGAIPDTEQLEKGLQSLSWDQFRTVVNAIPKLKADVDAYGPLGWQYVQANYRTYHWRKSINKLQPDQKVQLAGLIREARAGKAAD